MPSTHFRRLSLGAVLALVIAAGTQAETPTIIGEAPGRTSPTMRERQFARLVDERARAIERAFGDTFAPAVTELRIVFVRPDRSSGPPDLATYEPEARTLYFAHHLQYAETPGTTASALQYWPWYDRTLRDLYPVVQVIDGALWTAALKEAARERGLTWPHEQCNSFDVVERLPCEMLAAGVVGYTTRNGEPLFNENRMTEIWPEDLEDLRARLYRGDQQAYAAARKYGGYLLLRPLVREFGVARTLSYVAGAPFRIEDNNLRLSAQRYQDRAREALAW
jgi:hypothetical protein